VIAAVQAAFEEALESAEAAVIQVAAALAAIRAARVVAVAIARIGTRRVAFPIAVIEFAAAAVLVDFAAELRRTKMMVNLVAESAAMAARTAARFAAAMPTARGAARVAWLTTMIAKETIDQARLAVLTAMMAAVSNQQQAANNGQTSKLMRKHRELPPGNLERRYRRKRLAWRAIGRSQRANDQTTKSTNTGPLKRTLQQSLDDLSSAVCRRIEKIVMFAKNFQKGARSC
jgi:hypothetical protein